jgi:hypothetical protein
VQEYFSKRRPDINSRKCFNCGSDKTSISYGTDGSPYRVWRRINGEWHCHNCYSRLNKREKTKYKNGNRFKYKGKYVRTEQIREKRTGKCSWCSNNIFDGSCKHTQFHHIGEYVDSDPLANTVELCNSCHSKETYKTTLKTRKWHPIK